MGSANTTNRPAPPHRGEALGQLSTSGKWPSLITGASPGSAKPLAPLQLRPLSMPMGHYGDTACGKEGKSAFFALQKLLCGSVTASSGAPAHSPRTGTELPRQLFKILSQTHLALIPRAQPALALTASSSRKPTQGCKKLWPPHRLHPIPGLETVGGGMGGVGQVGGQRKVGGWALGPHPARPGACGLPRPDGEVTSVRSPHPEASRGPAAFLETGCNSINCTYWINSRSGSCFLGNRGPWAAEIPELRRGS